MRERATSSKFSTGHNLPSEALSVLSSAHTSAHGGAPISGPLRQPPGTMGSRAKSGPGNMLAAAAASPHSHWHYPGTNAADAAAQQAPDGSQHAAPPTAPTSLIGAGAQHAMMLAAAAAAAVSRRVVSSFSGAAAQQPGRGASMNGLSAWPVPGGTTANVGASTSGRLPTLATTALEHGERPTAERLLLGARAAQASPANALARAGSAEVRSPAGGSRNLLRDVLAEAAEDDDAEAKHGATGGRVGAWTIPASAGSLPSPAARQQQPHQAGGALDEDARSSAGGGYPSGRARRRQTSTSAASVKSAASARSAGGAARAPMAYRAGRSEGSDSSSPGAHHLQRQSQGAASSRQPTPERAAQQQQPAQQERSPRLSVEDLRDCSTEQLQALFAAVTDLDALGASGAQSADSRLSALLRSIGPANASLGGRPSPGFAAGSATRATPPSSVLAALVAAGASVDGVVRNSSVASALLQQAFHLQEHASFSVSPQLRRSQISAASASQWGALQARLEQMLGSDAMAWTSEHDSAAGSAVTGAGSASGLPSSSAYARHWRSSATGYTQVRRAPARVLAAVRPLQAFCATSRLASPLRGGAIALVLLARRPRGTAAPPTSTTAARRRCAPPSREAAGTRPSRPGTRTSALRPPLARRQRPTWPLGR